MILRTLAGLVLLAALPAHAEDSFDGGAIPAPKILMPAQAPAAAEVVLISDAAGWGAREEAMAKALTAQGAIVVGIDLPSWLPKLEAEDRDCVYITADIESLSQQVQRSTGDANYSLPLIAGIGAGGAQALAIAAQTPLATIGGTFAVDPTEAIALKKPLCTQAVRRDGTKAGTAIYALTPGALPDPVSVAFTGSADPAGRAHVKALTADWPDIAVSDSAKAPDAALTDLLTAAISAEADSAAPLGLPLAELPVAKPSRDTLAVVYSGDGGWRDIDRQIGDALQEAGIPVVGVDSLRYFWSERQPQETADDLVKIIDHYTDLWNVSKVVLVGYSFGADILPATYDLLPQATKDQVSQLSLLALSHGKSFQISVMGWFGQEASGHGDPVDDLKAVNPALVQCFYGKEEDDDPCPDLAAKGIETIGTSGGHHFDGDYEALAKAIAAGLDRRAAAAPKP
ncbi:MAG: AcvB/VirJ family lysyl-phosphatidylglycerol hydrolase [Amaricoccus sp.]